SDVCSSDLLKNADIVVENNRIKSVGARSGVPAGAKVFDVGGKTITPGFVDTHAHWFEIRRGILDRQNFAFLANLAYGVTAGLDVQTGTNDMFAYQDLVDRSEEHTSELQSRSDLVCRLLLEKKKT